MEQRKGIFEETYTGIFYPIDPRSDEVNLLDIAHALSLICRFGGQCKYFYSVAQHCLNVYQDLKSLGYNEKMQLYGLLHDASEAYISDIITPVKIEIPQYKEFEELIEKAIYEKFELQYPDEETCRIIKTSDNDVLYNEILALMNNKYNWASKVSHRRINIDTSFRNMIDVEKEYIDTAKGLMKKL